MLLIVKRDEDYGQGTLVRAPPCCTKPCPRLLITTQHALVHTISPDSQRLYLNISLAGPEVARSIPQSEAMWPLLRRDPPDPRDVDSFIA